MNNSKVALLLISGVAVAMCPTAALAADILPLKHGFYVARDTPCKDASFGSLSSYAGGNVFGGGHYSCTLKLMNKSGNKYSVSSKCSSERDDTTINMTEVYTITSETSFTVKNKNGEFSSRYCERSSLPSPWGDK
jgi:hypothetical protein